ncbi:hypothetical protein GSI_11603 [Ganoderma sinense ZZ0214-1]|uniref:Uncharacterized protein n=1 Tax=Ganoderma sinense ZZ0214-1 TaxID=1077348 RepID=A0A2G8RWF8_9APHY|nr:hypothetical protein GSI_11603 [Ganoderma sinense ZZ0214-1]
MLRSAAPFAIFFVLLSFWSSTILSAFASPYLPVPRLTQIPPRRLGFAPDLGAQKRQDGQPQFPAQPPSCPICEQNFANIDSCAQAAPVLQNFSMIIFNPGAFIDVIKCACTDTFQSAYPQCVDCFIQTNQTSFLDSGSQNLSSVVDGMHKICAIASTLLGGVATADGEVTPTSSTAAATATSSTSGASPLASSWSVAVAAVLSSIVAALL